MNPIVLIVGSYYPYFSAVGTCCFNVAEELIRKNNKVIVICMKSCTDQIMREEYRGQTIVRVSHFWWDIRLALNDKIRMSHGIKKKISRALLRIVQLKEYLQIVISKASLNKSWIDAYKKALKDIDSPIKVIIPFCFPMEAVVAAMDYKSACKHVKLIPYLFDQFAESSTLHRNKLNKRLKKSANIDIERTMLGLSEKVLAIHTHKKHILRYMTDHLDKIVYVEHPLIVNKYKEIKPNNNDCCSLIYAGNLFKHYIEPTYMLKLLHKINDKFCYILNLYGGGNCSDIIEKYRKVMPDKIYNNGYVKQNIIQQKVGQADIMISIAEVRGIQISSKIFEYVSAGKPIVHFYNADDDINVAVLKDYPLCLCLKQDYNLIEENADKLVQFCSENKGKKLDFSLIKKLYYHATPEFITQQITGTPGNKEWT